MVAEQFAAGTSSQATGGAVPDGDYELLSESVDQSDAGTSGPTGNQRKQTLRIAGNAVSATEDYGSGPQSVQYTLAYAGPTLVLTQTCPAGGGTLNFAYSMLSGPSRAWPSSLARSQTRSRVPLSQCSTFQPCTTILPRLN